MKSRQQQLPELQGRQHGVLHSKVILNNTDPMSGGHYALACQRYFYEFESSLLIRIAESSTRPQTQTEKILGKPLKFPNKNTQHIQKLVCTEVCIILYSNRYFETFSGLKFSFFFPKLVSAKCHAGLFLVWLAVLRE